MGQFTQFCAGRRGNRSLDAPRIGRNCSYSLAIWAKLSLALGLLERKPELGRRADCPLVGEFWIHRRGSVDTAPARRMRTVGHRPRCRSRKRQKDHCMSCIQLALSNAAKSDLLRSLLCRSTQLPVRCVESPCIEEACVVVVDPPHLRMMPSPLAFPERVVLITQNDANHLKDAWEAGVNSVVSDQDPPNTVVLAILSACLRNGSASPRHASGRPL
jgi:hypothetical protein